MSAVGSPASRSTGTAPEGRAASEGGAAATRDDGLPLTRRLGMRPVGGDPAEARVGRGRLLVVGVGGLGSAALRVLVRSGVGSVTLVDDDRVEEANLHRQTLYGSRDLGQVKVEAAARRLAELARSAGTEIRVTPRVERLLPGSARDLIRGHDVVLEGGDNFATKFLAADAAFLEGVPLVSAGAVRWDGWALASVPGRSACLRCVFEAVPPGPADSCAVAGILGPVVGVLGAVQAGLALRLLLRDATAGGVLVSYRALDGALRARGVRRRPDCSLCGPEPRIDDLRPEHYVPRTG
jgi:adenylyltransferase/sulfurtransferase